MQAEPRSRALFGFVDKRGHTMKGLMRTEHLRPPLVDIFDWVKQARSTSEGRNLATKALGYAVNQEKELMRVLDDGRLSLAAC